MLCGIKWRCAKLEHTLADELCVECVFADYTSRENPSSRLIVSVYDPGKLVYVFCSLLCSKCRRGLQTQSLLPAAGSDAQPAALLAWTFFGLVV